ncbi:MAG: hypothetical protein HAW62_02605, partial [Endozoicomonadaceae bacterium]|nr:hypothetical protein [Endozoicomonadaceae bacterium]
MNHVSLGGIAASEIRQNPFIKPEKFCHHHKNAVSICKTQTKLETIDEIDEIDEIDDIS